MLALVWSLIMFVMMPLWHVYGKQNLSNEAYRTTAEAFMAKTQAMVDQYTVRTETNQNIPVVRPPPGSDVYLIGRLWQWWPLLELEKGQTYRLHISSKLTSEFVVLPDERIQQVDLQLADRKK